MMLSFIQIMSRRSTNLTPWQPIWWISPRVQYLRSLGWQACPHGQFRGLRRACSSLSSLSTKFCNLPDLLFSKCKKKPRKSSRKQRNQVDVERARWWSEHEKTYYGIILRTPSWSQLSWHTWAARTQMDQPTFRIWTVTMRIRLQEMTMQMKPRHQKKVKKGLPNI